MAEPTVTLILPLSRAKALLREASKRCIYPEALGDAKWALEDAIARAERRAERQDQLNFPTPKE